MTVPRITVRNLHADLAAAVEHFAADTADVERSRARVEAALADGRAHYGINTGFGALANKRVPDDQLATLQRNLLLSHAVGVGDPVPPEVTRLMLGLKVVSLGLGYSGVSLPVFRRLVEFDRRNLLPVVPSRGSVGASGDLAPLAHLCLPLIGLGEFWDDDRRGRVPAADALRAHDLPPVPLAAKDGLALINGTQLMAAYGAWVLERCSRLVDHFDLAAAMSLEALQGSIKPFDARVHAVRPHPGHGAVAANVRLLLRESEILESHRNCGKVQDPYCLRCVPQVHGASRDALAYASGVLETEINGVTDNPLVFARDGAGGGSDLADIVSGGNFHGQPLALALDFAAIALAEYASISERRIYLLLEGHDGLPRLLMRETGLNSGFMIPQYTAAALVSENKVLCHPASVDSIPTSLGQEDHVSMGSVSAVKLLMVLKNVETVLAIELLTAAQALDYRLPLRPGRGVEAAHRRIREVTHHREADYLFQDDLRRVGELTEGRALLEAAGSGGQSG
ncbi:histidine ammonia-lyase [Frigoriglobus tundricola]|uniref:Histidine ammonia-lyase n=1 Tax=Frigoriglobus tundricola TaxID=2774151 RepID=A0A6M5YN87_9BACT|nr:histidine ammonia-lyase [Frigoriglobus tundricola]QJW95024.1 Histidine ammonia-lyase [Frigoriglobus tundricola]